MSKVIEAIYENGTFRPLEPVTLPKGEHVEVRVPEVSPTPHERLETLEAFEAIREELTEEQGEAFEEAVQRHPWFGGRQLDLWMAICWIPALSPLTSRKTLLLESASATQNAQGIRSG